ncbi:hypothetical protein EA772_01570 [Pedobacter sp. G11]|uniref:hypothetical protein n=1 Tax=Pedobacter sp. G11 TaxID=2482728 RepID=UPI000F5EF213|nr:hypothetical protein [Pedobacter sp. G11]AZI24094.1 hypothetical protein EA772_01570 [Pedobacter sp. G11]
MEKQSNIEGNKPTLVAGLRKKMLSRQRKLADHLNSKCREISLKVLLAMLISFTTLMSALLLKLIISAIY